MSLPDPDKRLDRSIKTQLAIGAVLALALIGGLGGWSAVTSIAAAVLAPATVVVESSKKAVQHDAGGIVAEINIKNGDLVERGDVLFRLDGTQIAAEIAALEKRLFDYSIRRRRLVAESAGKSGLGLPSELLKQMASNSDFSELVGVQERLLASRLGVREGQRKELHERIAQLRSQISGLETVRDAISDELKLFEEEVEGLRGLKAKQLISVPRYNTLRRAHAEKRGALGRTVADIAGAKGQISETEVQILKFDMEAQSEILKEMEALEGEVGQLQEQIRAARDKHNKLDIVASDRGLIHELAVHTIGGVVRAGDTLASIVPTETTLVVDAKVQTIDRDQVYPGMPTRVRFTAFSQRTTPELSGRVATIASDQSTDGDHQPPYYAVRIELVANELARLGGLEIKPGMPAEVMMTAQSRTVLSYFLKPITDQFTRAFRDE